MWSQKMQCLPVSIDMASDDGNDETLSVVNILSNIIAITQKLILVSAGWKFLESKYLEDHERRSGTV